MLEEVDVDDPTSDPTATADAEGAVSRCCRSHSVSKALLGHISYFSISFLLPVLTLTVKPLCNISPKKYKNWHISGDSWYGWSLLQHWLASQTCSKYPTVLSCTCYWDHYFKGDRYREVQLYIIWSVWFNWKRQLEMYETGPFSPNLYFIIVKMSCCYCVISPLTQAENLGPSKGLRQEWSHFLRKLNKV